MRRARPSNSISASAVVSWLSVAKTDRPVRKLRETPAKTRPVTKIRVASGRCSIPEKSGDRCIGEGILQRRRFRARHAHRLSRIRRA